MCLFTNILIKSKNLLLIFSHFSSIKKYVSSIYLNLFWKKALLHTDYLINCSKDTNEPVRYWSIKAILNLLNYVDKNKYYYIYEPLIDNFSDTKRIAEMLTDCTKSVI